MINTINTDVHTAEKGTGGSAGRARSDPLARCYRCLRVNPGLQVLDTETKLRSTTPSASAASHHVRGIPGGRQDRFRTLATAEPTTRLTLIRTAWQAPATLVPDLATTVHARPDLPPDTHDRPP